MHIKGRYVAQITLDIDYSGDGIGLKPFDEIKRLIKEELTPAIKELLKEEFEEDDFAHIDVAQLYADVYEVKEEA